MPYSREATAGAPDNLSKRLIRAAAVTATLLMVVVLLVAQWTSAGMLDRLSSGQADTLAREVRERIASLRSQTLQGADLLGLAVAAHNENPGIHSVALEDLGRRVFARLPEIPKLWIVPHPVDPSAWSSLSEVSVDAMVFTRQDGRIDRTGTLNDTDRALILKSAETGRPQAQPPKPSHTLAPGASASTHVEPLMVDQEIIGLVGYDIDAYDWVRIGLSVEHTVPDTRLSILTPDGVHLFSDDATQIGHETTTDPSQPGYVSAEDMRVLRAGSGFSHLHNLPSGAEFHRIGMALPARPGDYRQFLVLDVPTSGSAAILSSGMLLFGALSLGALALFLIALRALVHRMAGAPLEHLHTAIRLLDSGDHHIPPPAHLVERRDQIGDIARALDELRRSAGERRELREMVIRNARDVERMIAAIDVALDMILVLDADQQIIYANQAACNMVGARDPDDILGRHLHSLESIETTIRRVELQITDSLERDGFWEGVIENYCTSFGECIAAMETRFTQRPNGDTVIIARDVSARLTAASEKADLERRLSQMDKMDAVGRLAGGIAHDFNNLLGAIAGYADFLFCDLPVDSAQRDYASRIKRVCDRAKDMVHQILAFSRAGDVTLTPTLPKIIMGDVSMLLRSAIPSSATLELAVPDDLPRMMANGTQLVQVLVNLAINARDALPAETGRITVSARLWNGDSDPAEECTAAGWSVHKALPPRVGHKHVMFEVSDSGNGMTPDVVAKVFDPFFTTKDLGKGTGLGLAVVFGIVQGHDGGLIVCSLPNAGTILRVFIPVCPDGETAEDSGDTADIARPRTRRRCRVLVVDDEGDMGDMVSVGLERIGHEVAVCEDPQDAIDAFEEEPDAFDVVITDQTMPGITGVALIARLKARRPDLPCILYTGYSRMVDQNSALAAGADAFFLKPVKVSALAEAIDRLYGERSSSAQPGAVPLLEHSADEPR
ncbi:response regulator [Azospirillum doebereinerae]|uniref:hybrid sensor histidine kinase/response regulator n=1 Tax=Azospirillum doebereinerae TaxID=92933 RepID=UPI001EE5D033|nr:PAS domain-containing sensor histidine kinase [Azospirillum doebereinerae]MCG5243546.1 response regulator [Azospirillum doebereinerae]